MINLIECETESIISYGQELFRDLKRTFNTLEDIAQASVERLYNEFCDHEGNQVFSLVRIYRLSRYEELLPELQPLAGGDGDAWLALMGTAGQEDAWWDRRQSQRHQVVAADNASPMFRAAFEQLGLPWGASVGDVEHPQSDPQAWGTRSFFVQDALGNPLIPDQEQFVKPYNIHSVMGLGVNFRDETGALLVAFTNVGIDDVCVQKFAELTPFIMTLLASCNDRGDIWR